MMLKSLPLRRVALIATLSCAPMAATAQTCTIIGGNTICSDGSSSTTIGGTTIGSNGTVCTQIGATVICN